MPSSRPTPSGPPKPRPRASDGPSAFDEVWTRLKAGRVYRAERTGRVDLPSVDHGNRLDNVLEVPADYVPTRGAGRCASACTAAWGVLLRARATSRRAR